jgi:general secretion pathway protein G
MTRRLWVTSRAQGAESGFTLIEMTIVVAIMAILASSAVPLYELTAKREKEQELRLGLRQIREALDAYKRAVNEGRIAKQAEKKSDYPAKLEDLVEGAPDAKDPGKRKIYFLRRLPRDPMSPDPSLSAAETWGKRSYESPPENPQAGDDVFDVYSRSQVTGLNGIPYDKW